MIYQNIQITILPNQASNEELLKEQIAEKLKISKSKISFKQIIRKSIDARSKVQVKINLSVNVFTDT